MPCHDSELRRQVIEKLTEVGLRKPGKTITDSWTTVYNKVVCRWEEDVEPESRLILAEAKKALAQLDQKLEGIPDALRPLFADG